jgi:hypothetical protein
VRNAMGERKRSIHTWAMAALCHATVRYVFWKVGRPCEALLNLWKGMGRRVSALGCGSE